MSNNNQMGAAVAAIINAIDWEKAGLDLQAIVEAANQSKLGKPLTNWLVLQSWNALIIPDLVTQPKPTPSILKLVSTVKVSATASKFVAKDKFVVNTKRNAPVKISAVWDNFTNWFLSGDGKTEDQIMEQMLRYHKLIKSSVDGSIITELGGEAKAETTLSEMYSIMEKQKNGEDGVLLNNGWANIFYIMDQNSVLRAVRVVWGDGWDVGAFPIDYLDEWFVGYQVFSRNYVLESLEPSASAQA